MNEQKPKILVVDDEFSIRESFSMILHEKFQVTVAASGEAALKKLVDEEVGVVFLDIRMPGMDGIETLKRLKEIDGDVTVIMVTAVNDVQKASEAIKLGAEDYVVKPFDVPEILGKANKALQKRLASRQTKEIQTATEKFEDIELAGSSRQIEEIRNIVEDIAKKDLSVVIHGERGVEKELLARVIHKESKRALKPFFALTIGNINTDSLRSKLFGIGKGSFATTLEKQKGLFEAASGGTIYLNNIENLSPAMQKELTRVLEKNEITREEGSVPIQVDVRVICSSIKDPKELVAEKILDKNLYESLAEISIEIPPLRERSSDIPTLVSHFVKIFNKAYNRHSRGLAADAVDVLAGYPFPGNVDELKHIIETLILSSDEAEIHTGRLPVYLLANSSAYSGSEEGFNINFDTSYEILEKQFLEFMLTASGGDEKKTASLMGITQRALSAKIDSLKIKL